MCASGQQPWRFPRPPINAPCNASSWPRLSHLWRCLSLHGTCRNQPPHWHGHCRRISSTRLSPAGPCGAPLHGVHLPWLYSLWPRSLQALPSWRNINVEHLVQDVEGIPSLPCHIFWNIKAKYAGHGQNLISIMYPPFIRSLPFSVCPPLTGQGPTGNWMEILTCISISNAWVK